MTAVTADPATLPAIEISQQTTYLTGPLRADGSIDYAQAIDRLASEGVTAENNAAVLFCQAFGPAEIPQENRGRYFAGLGIDPLPESGTYLLSLAQSVQQRHPGSPDAAIQQQSQAMEGPWSRQQYPLVAEWLDGIQQPLDVLVQGTRRAKYYSPLILSADEPLEWALLPLTQQSRMATRALTARAMLHLGDGDVESARQDILAVHRLSRLLAQGPSVIDALVAVAVDGLACQADAVLANSPLFTRELATSYLADLQALDPLPNMADKVHAHERFVFLDIIQRIPSAGLEAMEVPENIRQYLETYAASPVAWNDVLRSGNTWHVKRRGHSSTATSYAG